MGSEQENVELVRRFCAAWSGLSPDELAGYFAEDAVYHNIPMEPARGKPAIRSFLEQFATGASAASFELARVAATGNVVMTERVDRFTIGDRVIELPVAGVFEIGDGKITAWRDYFDLATWTKQARG
jgi:limonene-1,2-epoxide hydrolase